MCGELRPGAGSETALRTGELDVKRLNAIKWDLNQLKGPVRVACHSSKEAALFTLNYTTVSIRPPRGSLKTNPAVLLDVVNQATPRPG